MIIWDKNATKVTNTASKDKLMVASYCALTIFPTSTTLTILLMSIVATTPLATKIGQHFQTNGVIESGSLIFFLKIFSMQ